MPQDTFDPYCQWLGIEDPSRPLSHYALLGLDPRENDPRQIARAADAQMAKVRRIRPGERLGDWGRLLDQLSTAKACLLDPASKAAYDADPQGSASQGHGPTDTSVDSASFVPPPPEPLAAAVDRFSPPSTPPTGEIPRPDPSIARAEATDPAVLNDLTSTGGGWPIRSLLIALVLSLVVAALGLEFYRVVNEPKKGPPLARRPESPRTQSPKPEPLPVLETNTPLPPQQPIVEDAPPLLKDTPPVEPVVEQPPPLDARKRAAFDEALRGARLSMSERDLAAAKAHLSTAAANVQTSEANVQTSEDLRELDRLEEILDHLGQFWDGIRQGMAGLESGHVLAVGNTRIAVVEASRDELLIRLNGRNRRYTIAQLPAALIKLLGGHAFTGDPASKVFVGAFFLMDAKGDRQQARILWKEAARDGIQLDHLLPELDRE